MRGDVIKAMKSCQGRGRMSTPGCGRGGGGEIPIRHFRKVKEAQKRKRHCLWWVPFLPSLSPWAWVVEVENSNNFKRDLLKCMDLLYVTAFSREPSAHPEIL